ncbi:MAG: flavodoxin-dependent (E)-4-hydroxy-3-methylbut-2-enyl-diphosphate synthase [bacterium]|nr:flavodoxin-dependent (E)-4-hydroxy-3-methylbut-2-enyl-diphosphate synthase [candidate division KSB1 bacterium]MDH7560562.1 flavodoxin-dependent (E)-4-hydroxy-3-methylbut-2-enyl-diphosphate synthase [bacterium]
MSKLASATSALLRSRTRRVMVGDVAIGGGAPVSVQSMTKTYTADVAATIAQIQRLQEAGCEIVRVAVPDQEAAEALPRLVRQCKLPVVADIHFDYRLAIAALQAGVHKLRINPGNIGGAERAKKVLREAKERGVPVRIGVNAGSLEKDLYERHGGAPPEALVASALRQVELCQDIGFDDIVLSLKASDVLTTIEAYRLIARHVDFPLHLGITEAGTRWTGTVKSAVGIGVLLAEGIGDTIRVSLAGDPVEEVRVGWEILKSLRLRKRGVTVIACPTCGRTEVDVAAIAEELGRRLAAVDKELTVAVMGCAVNGPGEAKEADVGVACGKKAALLFRRGTVVGKIREEEIVERLLREVEEWPSVGHAGPTTSREEVL